MGFDHFTNTITHVENTPQALSDLDSASEGLQYKKKWGLLGKVLSFGTGASAVNDLETVRRDNCTLVQTVIEKVLRMILINRNVNGAQESVKPNCYPSETMVC